MKGTSTAKITRTEPASKQPVSIGLRRLSLVSESAVQPESTVEPTTVPIWSPTVEPSPGVPTTSEVLHIERQLDQFPPTLEAEIVATLTRPLAPDETHRIGGENRERDLRAIFARLTPLEAHQLRRRLDAERSDDKLVLAFRRVTIERRTRLKALLAEPRRRAIKYDT